MSDTFQKDLEDIKREILELKTAKTIPSTFGMFSASQTIRAGKYTDNFMFWRIYYEDVGDATPPITIIHGGAWFVLRTYNSGANTQDIECFTFGNRIFSEDETYLVNSSRPINRIEQITQPSPIEEWTQVLNFYPADMGTAVGWCLQNCRLGFHIYTGTYASAKADADAQQANGTLHADLYPPSYLAVPIYIDNGNWDGHVGVWDHGTFYSDGYIINDYVSYYGAANIRGWGEFCDGARVVQHV